MQDKVQKRAKKQEPVKRNNSQTANSMHASLNSLPAGQKIMSLHQTLGNRAVQRLFESGTIQTKLKIGQSNDKYEQEADRVADEVMRMPEPQVQRQTEEEEEEELIQPKSIGNQITPLVQRQIEPEEEEEETIQAKSEGQIPQVTSNLESRINALQGGGQPLSKETRDFFEPRFGHDFSRVRVHTDSNANQLARSINARAFTRGNNIVFGSGLYLPEIAMEKRLLAHELAHVIQQSPKGPSASIAHELTHVIQQSKGATGAAMVQRAGDPAQAPPMNCGLATSTPANVVQEILFAQNSAVVPASDVLTLQHITAGWALNGSPDVRIDGYASVEGSQPHNWTLSCCRAEAIKSILTSAPQGIPADRIQIVTHGEGEEAGAQRPANRRATVDLQFPTPTPTPTPSGPICGPDITSSLTTMLGTVGPWFRGLSTFRKHRSCVALGPGAPLVGVNPIMAWDTRELFLPNTSWLDVYFQRRSCGSPRDAGCATDPRRHLCETAGTCGNSVVVGGKCMLAGTANYALFGKMCRLCHDETSQWGRWDMRAIIGAWKMIRDDSTPPKEVASAAYDGTFPTVPAAAENRGSCAGRCGLTHGGAFDFIWEPYKSR